LGGVAAGAEREVMEDILKLGREGMWISEIWLAIIAQLVGSSSHLMKCCLSMLICSQYQLGGVGQLIMFVPKKVVLLL
jgi:hypothetical protein